MTRKRCNRKKREVNPTAGFWAVAEGLEIDQDHATKLMNRIRVAYQRMRDGGGTDSDFDSLAATLNVGLIRAEVIAEPVVDGIKAGMEALLESDRLNGTHGRYGFTGPGILAMNCAMDLYEQILRNSTPKQMELAAAESMRRMRAGKVRRAGEVTP